MVERRKYPRLRDRRQVRIHLSSGDHVTVWNHNVSQGGIQVYSQYSADIGDRFQIEFSIPDGDKDRVIRALCRVAHVIFNSSRGKFNIGLEFVEFAAGCREPFDEFTDHLARRHYRR